MNALNSRYGDRNFTILAFPCNIFGLQEPGANATEIYNGIKYVRPGNGFTPNFTLMQKILVNGDSEHPLYTYLKSNCPATTTTFQPSRLFYSPIRSNDVAWNWEKFIVGKDGRVLHRAHPSVNPESLTFFIDAELSRPV
nr:glutathione peroxidase-like [Biomphalaria glabrata]